MSKKGILLFMILALLLCSTAGAAARPAMRTTTGGVAEAKILVNGEEVDGGTDVFDDPVTVTLECNGAAGLYYSTSGPGALTGYDPDAGIPVSETTMIFAVAKGQDGSWSYEDELIRIGENDPERPEEPEFVILSETEGATVVEITCEGADTIMYTTSGKEGYREYNEPFTLTKTAVVSAAAQKNGQWNYGDEQITVIPPPPPPPDPPLQMPEFVPEAREFVVYTGTSKQVKLGAIRPGPWENLEQIDYYYRIKADLVDGDGLKDMAEAITLRVDSRGNVIMHIANARASGTFSYSWGLEPRYPGFQEVLAGAGGTIEGNRLTVVESPDRIVFEAAARENSISMLMGQRREIDLGVISNYAAFLNENVEIEASSTLGQALIDDKGRVTLVLENPEAGTYAPVITLSAPERASVRVFAPTVVVERPRAAIAAEAREGAFKDAKGAYTLLAGEGAAQFSVPFHEVEKWTSSKPKAFTIDPATGEAAFSKAVKDVKITALLADGSQVSCKVNVVKGDAFARDMVFQVKKGGEWVDAQEIRMAPGQKTPTRLYARDGGKLVIESVKVGDDEVATRAAKATAPVKARKAGRSQGKETAITIVANGQTFVISVAVSSEYKGLTDGLEKKARIVEIEELE
ncbi:MAG: hypothetical protein Q4C03_01735 [bacterium]|nr:hypothetical protein [bacterium]